MSGAKIRIELSQDEALVLFEFLSRFIDVDELRIDDEAEARVLSNVLASLEKLLVQPFLPNYTELVFQARRRVRDE